MRCSVDDCGRDVWARTWCKTHYDRWRRTGELDYFPPIWLDAEPLIVAVERRGLPLKGRLDESDRRAYGRAKQSGRVTDLIADRLAVRLLSMTLDELYGYDYDGVAA